MNPNIEPLQAKDLQFKTEVDDDGEMNPDKHDKQQTPSQTLEKTIDININNLSLKMKKNGSNINSEGIFGQNKQNVVSPKVVDQKTSVFD